MKAVINTQRCIGCGLCMDGVPQYFKLGESHAQYIGPPEVDKEGSAIVDIRAAMALCPAKAISLQQSWYPCSPHVLL